MMEMRKTTRKLHTHPACYGTMYNHSEDWIERYCIPCKSEFFNKCKKVSPHPNDEKLLKTMPCESIKIKDEEIKSKW